ncbi:MAG: DUF6057 family protein [Bacteroidia bacterium]|nr:DUF6057 family protein [Bacteroidia bacterium]
MSASEKKRFGIVALGLTFLSFLFFQLFYAYHLFFKEQIQLFLFNSDYFLSYFNKPAWLACYAGDYLTQFFYLRGGGATVLSLLFCLEWLLCSFVIKRISATKNAPLWGLFPVAIDWMLHCDLLYRVSASVGFILVLILFLIYSSISKRWLSTAFGLIMAFIGYWLAGSSFLVFPLLIMVYDWEKGRSYLLKWLLIGAVIFLIPIALRHYYLLTITQSYIYPAMNLQSILLRASLILVLMAAFFLKRFEVKYSRIFNITIPFAFIFLLLFGIRANASFDREKILSLDNEFYFGNTDRVIELSQKYNLKSRSATYFTNMALAKKGELPEYLLDFYQPAASGLILPVMPDENWQSIFVSNEVFFLLGDMNLAQHSAMLGNTFSPYQRSSRMIKRLAEINMVNEDSAGANKYLRILSKTLFHKKWAESRQAMNHVSASDKWLIGKRAQIPQVDTLRKSNYYLTSLSFLVEQNPNNLIALDYLLCYHLLNKDLKSFRKVYDQYGRLINRPVPSLYGEALLIQLLSSQASQDEVASYAISPKKIKDFADYTQLFEKTKGEINALSGRFGKSYWFYYHFATIQKR